MIALAYWFLKAYIYQRVVRSFKHSAKVHQERTDWLQLQKHIHQSVQTPQQAGKGHNSPSSRIYRAIEWDCPKTHQYGFSVTALFKVLAWMSIRMCVCVCECACKGGHDCSVPTTSRAGMCIMINWWDHGSAWLCAVWDQTKLTLFLLSLSLSLHLSLLSLLFFSPLLSLSLPLARSAKSSECWLAIFCIFEGRGAEVSTFHL